jgi:hypothetical protein
MDLEAIQTASYTRISSPRINVTIEGELAAESLYDALKQLPILFQHLGIEGGHHATTAKILNADHYVADA